MKKRIKTAVCLSLAALMLSVFAACSQNTKTGSDNTPDEKTASGVKSSTDEKAPDKSAAVGCVNLSMDRYGREGDNIVVCGGYKNIFRCSADKKTVTDLGINAVSVCVNNGLIYYTCDNEGYKKRELHSVSFDGTGDKLVCSAKYAADYFALRGEKVYYSYYVDEGTNDVYEFDAKCKKTEKLPVKDAMCCFAAGNKLYYISGKTSGEYDSQAEGKLMSFDLDTRKTETLTDEKVGRENIYLGGSELFFWVPDNPGEIKSLKLYKVDPEKNTAALFKTIKADGQLLVSSFYGDRLIYQDFASNTYDFVTYSLSLKDGKIQKDENANFNLIKDPTWGSSVFSVDRKVFIFDDKSGRVRRVTNNEEKACEYYYCDADVCVFKIYEDDETRIEKTKLSDDLPLKEDLMKDIKKSSPDNEYVRIKKYLPGDYNTVKSVIELTIDSADARKINAELENEARQSMYGTFHRSYVVGDYVSIFFEGSYEGGHKSLYLKTIQISTGKTLDKDQIINLVSSDTEEFYNSLKLEIRKQQRNVYSKGETDFEAELYGDYDREGNNIEPSEDKLQSATSKKTLNNYNFAYLGEGRLLCVGGFRHYAGAEGGIHAFEFQM